MSDCFMVDAVVSIRGNARTLYGRFAWLDLARLANNWRLLLLAESPRLHGRLVLEVGSDRSRASYNFVFGPRCVASKMVTPCSGANLVLRKSF